MKKTTFLLFTLLMSVFAWQGHAQIAIGERDGSSSNVPIHGLWNYSYSQQVVYQNEINASGDITSISFYYISGTPDKNDNWDIYLGHTSKTSFLDNTDWEPVANLTQVFSGTVTFPAGGNMMLVTFDIPFTYNGSDNLVVAVTENKSGYSSTSFGKTTTVSGSNRSIYWSSDDNPADVNNPPAAKGRLGFINNMILGGIQQSCPAPNQLASSSATNTSVDVSWTAGNSEAAWNISWGTPGYTPGDVNELGTDTVTATSYQIAGLTASSAYQFYVQADCGGGELSAFEGPFNFSTLVANDNLCDAIPLTMDAVSAGDAYTTAGATSQPSEVGGTCFSSSGALNSVWFSFVAPLYGNVTVTTDIAGGTLNDTQIAVYEAAADCSDLGTLGPELGCDQDGGGTFGHNWRSVVTLTGLTEGNTYYVQVDGYSDNVGTFGVEVHNDGFLCANPSSLISYNVTTTTADVSWIEGGSEATWNISWGTPGYTPGDVNELGTDTATTSSYQLTGLTASSTYAFYVQADCVLGQSDWIGPLNFATACSYTSVPYLEDFESATTPNLPNCTSRENLGAGNNWTTTTYNSGDFSGKVLKYGWTSANAGNAWFYTQGIELEAGTSYVISYRYGNNSVGYTESMKVAYGTSANAAAMTNPLADYPTISALGSTVEELTFTVPADGIYYIGFHAYSVANQFNLYVDEISVDIDNTVSIEDYKELSGIRLYPNPINDNTFFIHAPNLNKEKVAVVVNDMLGREIYNTQHVVSNGKVQINLNQGVTTGVYLVTISSNGNTQSFRVIKR